jgi:hypothetical protein
MKMASREEWDAQNHGQDLSPDKPSGDEIAGQYVRKGPIMTKSDDPWPAANPQNPLDPHDDSMLHF